MHYWYGCIDTPYSDYLRDHENFRVVVDNLKLTKDLGNKIPDKSWMLYLLELFNTQKVPIELNLICQFDNQDYFEAIFRGRNQYRFRKIIPKIGGSYQREIRFKENESIVEFFLMDLETNIEETFSLDIDPKIFKYRFHQCFSGVEWWNKIQYNPFPLRYEVYVSNLMYGYNDDSSDPSSIIYFPIGNVYENKDGQGEPYPIEIAGMDRVADCICYTMR